MMHYFKFDDDLRRTFIRTTDYIKLEIRQDGGPWKPFAGGDAWSVGSRTATKEEAEA